MEEKLHLSEGFVAVLYMADRIQAPRECLVRALPRVFLLVLHLDYPNRFSSSPTMTLNSNVVQLSRRRFPPISFGPHIKTCLAFSSERSYLFEPLVYSNLTPLDLVVGLEEFKLSFTDTGAWLWQFILTPQCSFFVFNHLIYCIARPQQRHRPPADELQIYRNATNETLSLAIQSMYKGGM